MPGLWNFGNLIFAANEPQGLPWWLPFAMAAALAYFLLLRPSLRQQRELTDKLAGLKKNDRVETFGGIRGTIVVNEAGSDEVILRVDDNNGTRLHVRRDAVSRVLSGGKSDEKEKS